MSELNRLFSEYSNLITLIISVGGLLGTLVTAVATFLLWRVTIVLAKETKRMVDASAQPHVVATIEPNRWSMMHFDLHVSNTGNATAYDVKVVFTPEIVVDGRSTTMPLSDINILMPGAELSSFLRGFKDVTDKDYEVAVSWKKAPSDSVREKIAYHINFAHFRGLSRLGRDPVVQVADEVKKMREDLSSLVRGSRRLGVDVYTSNDRRFEEEALERRFAEINQAVDAEGEG